MITGSTTSKNLQDKIGMTSTLINNKGPIKMRHPKTTFIVKPSGFILKKTHRASKCCAATGKKNRRDSNI